MFSTKTPTFLLLSLIFSFNIFAQKPAPIEFGKISMEDLKMKSYAKDTSAEAVVLCDYGENFTVLRVWSDNLRNVARQVHE